MAPVAPRKPRNAKGRCSTEAVTEGLGQIPLARDAGQLLFGPCKKRLNLWPTVRPAHRETHIGSLTRDVAFDVVECPDPVQRRAGDLGFGRRPDIVEVTTQMRPTGCLAEPASSISFRFVKLRIAFVAVRRANDPPGAVEKVQYTEFPAENDTICCK